MVKSGRLQKNFQITLKHNTLDYVHSRHKQPAQVHFIEVFINRFLIYKKKTVNKKSYNCCVSKLRNFADFISTLKIRHVSDVKKKDIKAHAARLSEAGLSHVTIDKYIRTYIIFSSG